MTLGKGESDTLEAPFFASIIFPWLDFADDVAASRWSVGTPAHAVDESFFPSSFDLSLLLRSSSLLLLIAAVVSV